MSDVHATSSSGPSSWPARLWNWLRLRLAAGGKGSRKERSRRIYDSFRDILVLNDAVLELIADLEEALAGRQPAALDALSHRIRQAGRDVAEMARLLNGMADSRHHRLGSVVAELREQLEGILPFSRSVSSGPYALPLCQLRATRAHLVGTKMANLGEAWWGVAGLEVPDGFVITANAFGRFMSHNQLWPAVDRLEAVAARGDLTRLGVACAELERQILAGEVPDEVVAEVAPHAAALFDTPAARVAVRSSAIGEDRTASHAGQYHTVLNVTADGLWVAYRRVIASAYGVNAVAYRAQRGLPAWEASMAVGCLRMVEARCSGIMFSRDYLDPTAERVVLSVVPGISDGITAGRQAAEEWVVSDENLRQLRSAWLDTEDLGRLMKAARLLEGYFKRPQDIEWSLEGDRQLVLLQTRPMGFAPQAAGPPPEIAPGATPLLTGGATACPGAAVGTVVRIARPGDLDFVGEDVVLVAPSADLSLSRVLPRLAALVAEVGSPTGHCAILAREFAVPCLLGVRGALTTLRDGQVVTVDAHRARVFDGEHPVPARPRRRAAEHDAEAQALDVLRRAAELVVPLRLTDPTSKAFAPRSCRSLHDVTRYVHEKVFAVMFRFGEVVEGDRENAVKLNAPLPFQVLVYDLGGGLHRDGGAPEISAEQVAAAPMRAFLDGLLDPRINWRKPRPVSTSGFLSVVGENMIGPPAEAQDLGKTSFAVVSDRYLNFSTKAGYHFSMVDCYCGRSLNKNYIHFRFAGGGASVGRRSRRVRFIDKVLTAMEFTTRARGDVLTGQLRKRPAEELRRRLTQLGHLTMVTRQLDMLMDTDQSPEFFAEAFLADRLEVF